MRPRRYELDVTLGLGASSIAGQARISLVNDAPVAVREVSLLLNRRLTVRPVTGVRSALVAMEDLPAQQVLRVLVSLPAPLPPGGESTIDLAFEGTLGDYVEAGMAYIRDRIDPAFTLLRRDAFAYPVPGTNSHRAMSAAGLPRFEWEARITVPTTHAVASVGQLIRRAEKEHRATYHYRGHRPSWRMDFAVAPYEVKERNGRQVHHFPEDGRGAARVMDAVDAAFRLYSAWFGDLPGLAPFTVIEIPDGWGSQADVTGILQSAAAFRDPARFVEVYHEVSHLFNAPSRDRNPPRWDEGLAMFLQYRVADHLDGTDRGREAEARTRRALRDRIRKEPRILAIPMCRYGEERMTDLTYSVGMLMFCAIWREVGPATFDRFIGGFLRKYRETGATTREFARSADAAAGGTLGPLFDTWLFTTGWCSEVTGPGD